MLIGCLMGMAPRIRLRKCGNDKHVRPSCSARPRAFLAADRVTVWNAGTWHVI